MLPWSRKYNKMSGFSMIQYHDRWRPMRFCEMHVPFVIPDDPTFCSNKIMAKLLTLRSSKSSWKWNARILDDVLYMLFSMVVIDQSIGPLINTQQTIIETLATKSLHRCSPLAHWKLLVLDILNFRLLSINDNNNNKYILLVKALIMIL